MTPANVPTWAVRYLGLSLVPLSLPALLACSSSDDSTQSTMDSGAADSTARDSTAADRTAADSTATDGGAADSGAADGGASSDGDAGGGGGEAGVPLACDDTLKTAFKPDANTTVLLVKAFKQGDPLVLSATDGGMAPPNAAADVCLVKLLVGPGFQDTSPTAPSTSPGIGIEVWLPAPSAWNNRIQNLGGGVWQGGNHASLTAIGQAQGASIAAAGYLCGTTDTGHGDTTGSFAMTQDGGINRVLWEDFAERSLDELALKTKALAKAYYGKDPQYSYWNGCSTGGRQGYKIAQTHPEYYNGYLVGAPAFNWTKFITTELHPEIVMQQDLADAGEILTTAQLTAVSAAAVSACDAVGDAGAHLGFILDPSQCHYDPTKDPTVLCPVGIGDGGASDGGDGGASTCVTPAQAQAINKIWYGQTPDGTVPDPATDNSPGPTLANNQLWWGLTRGTTLQFLANPAMAFFIATDQVALEMQDPTLAVTSFTNATGNGANKWTGLSYADLATAFRRGIDLQPSFGNINTDNPDLSAARTSGAKIISYHGLADFLITPTGSTNYYSRASATLGGNEAVNAFNRLFLIPGMGHCGTVGSVSGTAGPALTPNNVPLPGQTQFFSALVDWVEHGNAPGTIVLQSMDSSVSLPVCPYPQKGTYNGTGSITAANSYTCK
jgi:Tannase and feruloyl esterase